jgi:hypothetical protein
MPPPATVNIADIGDQLKQIAGSKACDALAASGMAVTL